MLKLAQNAGRSTISSVHYHVEGGVGVQPNVWNNVDSVEGGGKETQNFIYESFEVEQHPWVKGHLEHILSGVGGPKATQVINYK